MASTGQNGSDLQFTADLQDNVSPTADQIEQRLKQLGASKTEIKVFLTAYDQATTKIKQAQDVVNKMPKNVMVHVQTNADQAHKKIQDLKNLVKAPLTLTIHVKDDIDQFTRNFKTKFMRLEQEMQQGIKQMPITSALLGLSRDGVGLASNEISSMTGGAINPSMLLMGGMMGGMYGGASLFAESLRLNSSMQQQMMQLGQLLRSPSAASSEYQSVANFSNRTPFNMTNVLQTDIQLRNQGINPNNPTLGLRGAGNLAAATGVPLAQASGAISAANQGYFQSLNNITGMNIRQSDFTYGGRESGKTYEQALTQILSRYTGALRDQTNTFKGLATNIQDAITQKIIMPAGQSLFQGAGGLEKSIEQTVTSNQWQLGLSREIDKLNQGMVKLFGYVQQAATYFKNSLEQPLKSIGKEALSLGESFAKAFGATTLQGIKYLSEGLQMIVTPLGKIASMKLPIIGNIGQFEGVLKALHMFGISTNTGLGNIFGGLASLNLSKTVHGFGQLTSMIAKIGTFETVKVFLDMKNGLDQLNASFSTFGKKGGDALDMLKVKMDAFTVSAASMGQTVAATMQYGAQQLEALHLNPNRVGPGTAANLAYFGGTTIDRLSTFLGNGADVSQAAANYMAAMGTGNQINASGGRTGQQAMQNVYREMTQAAEQLHQSIGVSLPQAVQDGVVALRIFSQSLQQAHMVNPSGASFAYGLENTITQNMNASDYGKFGSPQQMTSSLLSSAASPGASIIRAALRNHTLNSSWAFRNRFPNLAIAMGGGLGYNTSLLPSAQSAMSEFHQNQTVYTSSLHQQQLMHQQFGGLVPGLQLPIFQNPLAQAGYQTPSASQLKNLNVRQDAQLISNFADAGAKAQNKLEQVNAQITQLNNTLQQYSIVQAQSSAALSKFDLQTLPMQENIQHMQDAMQNFTLQAVNPLQRAMTAAAQKLADFQQYNVVPVQRAQDAWNQTMLMTSNQLDNVSNSLRVAQYNMQLYNEGMLKGENAATLNIEKLNIYSQKLQELQLLNNGLNQDISRNVVNQGFSSTVAPLMGFDLQREEQLAQNRAQLQQDVYNTTYGYKHWQLQRAARTYFQAHEMGFSQRMRGTIAAAASESRGAFATEMIQNKMFQEQLKSRVYEEKMYELQVKQYPMQDQQFILQKQMTAYQQKMSINSDKIAAAQLKLTEQGLSLNFKAQRLNDLINIRENGPGGLNNRSLMLNSEQGNLTNLVASVNNIEGDLLKAFQGNVRKGNEEIIKHIPAIARDMHTSTNLLAGIDHFVRGGQGGHGGWNAGAQNPSIHAREGILSRIWNALTANPLTYLATGANAAANAAHWGANQLGIPMGGTLGTVAGVGAAGFIGLSGLNTLRIASDQAQGRFLWPAISRGLKASGAERLGGWAAKHGENILEGAGGHHFFNTVDAAGNTVPGIADALSRPMSFLWTKLASIVGFGAGSTAAHAIPGVGPLLSLPMGVLGAQSAETATEKAVQGAGRFPIARYVGGTYLRKLVNDVSEIRKAFDKGPIQFISRSLTEIPRLITRLVTVPLGGIFHLLGNVRRNFTGRVGGIVKKFTAQDPGVVAVQAGDKQTATVTPADITRNDTTNPLEKTSSSSATSGDRVSYTYDTTNNTTRDVRTVVNDVTKKASDVVNQAKDVLGNVKDKLPTAVDKLAQGADKMAASSNKYVSAGGDFAKAAIQEGQNVVKTVKSSDTIDAAAQDLKAGSSIFKDIISSRFAKLIEEFGGFEGKFGKAVGAIGLAGGIFAEWGGKLKDLINGPFNAAVNIFKDATSHVSEAFGSFISWVARTLHISSPSKGLVSDTAKLTEGTAAEASRLSKLVGKNSVLDNVLSKASSIGAKAIDIGGKVFRVAGAVGTGIQLFQGTSSLLHGKVAQGIGQFGEAALYGNPLTAGILTALQGLNTAIKDWAPKNAANRPIALYGGEATALASPLTMGGPNGPGIGNYYDNQIQALQHALDTQKNMTAQQRADDLKKLAQYRTDAAKVNTVFDNIDQQNLTDYLKLTSTQQQQAQQAALNGPQGLSNYLQQVQKMQQNSYQQQQLTTSQSLTTQSNRIQQHMNAVSSAWSQHFSNINNEVSSGYKAIGQTSANYLNGLTKTIDAWAKKNGINISGAGQHGHSGTVNVSGTQAPYTMNNGGAQITIGAAAGGHIVPDKHKIGLDRGRMVRMVEEGHPEVVIPLAPHRRDRAKNLIKHTAGMLGMAAGGYVNPIGPGATPERIDMGVDYAGSNVPLYALGSGTITNSGVGTGGWGPTWINLRLNSGRYANSQIYYAEQIRSLVKTGQAVKAGQHIADLVGGMEIGFATGSGNSTTSMGAAEGFTGGNSTAAGVAMSNLIRSLGGPAGILQGAIAGKFGGSAVSYSGGSASVPPLHLAGVPGSLMKMGIIGPLQHKILERAKNKLSESVIRSIGFPGGIRSSGIHSGGWWKVAGQIAKRMGWDKQQLDDWYGVEQLEDSPLSLTATNSSGAYGLAQMLGSSGLSSSKAKYYTYGGNPNTIVGQLTAMANYIKKTYGTPANALAHEHAHHWYAGGIPRIARDNTPAILHAGETVLQAGQVNSGAVASSSSLLVAVNEVTKAIKDVWSEHKPLLLSQTAAEGTANKWLQQLEGLSQSSYINSLKTARGVLTGHPGTPGAYGALQGASQAGIFGTAGAQMNNAIDQAVSTMAQKTLNVITATFTKRVANKGTDINVVTHTRMSNVKSLKIDEKALHGIESRIDDIRSKMAHEKKGSAAYKKSEELLAKLEKHAREIRDQIKHISHLQVTYQHQQMSLLEALHRKGLDKQQVKLDEGTIQRLKKELGGHLSHAARAADLHRLHGAETRLKIDRQSLDDLSRSISKPLAEWVKEEEKKGVSMTVIRKAIEAAMKGTPTSSRATTQRQLDNLGSIGKYTGGSRQSSGTTKLEDSIDRLKKEMDKNNISAQQRSKIRQQIAAEEKKLRTSGHSDKRITEINTTAKGILGNGKARLNTSKQHLDIGKKHLDTATRNLLSGDKRLGIAGKRLDLAGKHLGVSMHADAIGMSRLGIATSHLGIATKHLGVSTHADAIGTARLGIATKHLGIATQHLGIGTQHLAISTGHYGRAEALSNEVNTHLKSGNNERRSGHGEQRSYHQQAIQAKQNDDRHFQIMITHLQNISNKVQQLNPVVQNNITIDISGRQIAQATSVGSGSVRTR